MNDAIKIYVGYGKSIAPVNDLDFLEGNYDLKVKNQVLSIFDELNRIQIDWNKLDLVQAAKMAVAEICEKYPFIEEDTKKAMEWKFTFDWR